ncbi:hypothetical protein BDZ97DRAFT_1901252 [Flammula alnicola]|nr:hypothetical protein BDZ97DRAFT_1901252 [Flammula alnicola]
MSYPTMVSRQPEFAQEPISNVTDPTKRAGLYTPQVQAQYGRGDGTFYSSHPQVKGTAMSDDEFNTSTTAITYSEPLVYCYPDAHPALETFPRSSQSPGSASVPQVSATSDRPSEHKRKDGPTTVSPETTIITKRIKIEGRGSRGRIRTADFDELTRSIIEETISIYRAQIGGVEPFPERADDRDTVKQAWVEVCTGRNLRIELEEDIFKLVVSRASQARGYAKTTSRPYFISAYNIDSLRSKREIRDSIEQLLEGAQFIYKDPAAKTGIFRAPLIQTLVNKIWFKNKEDDGAIHPEFSEDDMLPIATVAFAQTVIENNLDEWVTGEHVDVPFTAAAYKAKYRTHLKRIMDFEKKTCEADIIPRLLRHMLKAARKHAKVSEEGAPQVANISDAEIEAAKQEWEGLVLSDDE